MDLPSTDLQHAINLFFADRAEYNMVQSLFRIGLEDVKREFKKKAMSFHPDRAKLLGKERHLLEERFKELNHAYGLLSEVLSHKNILLKNSRQHSRHPGSAGSSGSAGAKSSDTKAKKAPKKHGNKRKTGPSFFFTGDTPKRRLRFAEYLFYTKSINWNTLIQAIVWQNSLRPKLGQVAVLLNYLENQHILEIIHHKNFRERFGQAAMRLGYLSNYQLMVVLGKQKSYNLPIGRFFLEQKIIQPNELRAKIHENHMHNFHFSTKNRYRN